jgi:hypothetical protein
MVAVKYIHLAIASVKRRYAGTEIENISGSRSGDNVDIYSAIKTNAITGSQL